ncbi:MAG: UDP-N-acetylmuramate--L-alanine ligase [Gammaproteobacteria bacterium]
MVNVTELGSIRHIHFVGIGGAGMSGIAEVLLRQNYQVTGSDIAQNAVVQHLMGLGATISLEHQAENIVGADVIVTSSIISPDNPEVVAARAAQIPVIHRAQMLAMLMQNKNGIAIAGTHGKTTTTSLAASMLAEGGMDPTFVIGGILKSAGANAHLGQSDYFVAEADESDASFLYLHPKIIIVTNIDADHLGTYGGDFNKLCDAFVDFIQQLPTDGLAVLCLDDPIVRQMIPRITRPIVTYGFDTAADLRIINFRPDGFQTHFTVHQTINGQELNLTLNLPGTHNVLNATAACAVAMHINVPHVSIQQALQKFAGVARRMQIYGEFETTKGKILLIDDYGHHPREIKATWSAIRQAWPDRRLVVIYQPHRYTRTQDLFEEFVAVLSEEADQLILLDVYAAGEQPIIGADGLSLFQAVEQRAKPQHAVFVPQLSLLPKVLQEVLDEGDIVLTQGAGNVGTVAPRLATNGFHAWEQA